MTTRHTRAEGGLVPRPRFPRLRPFRLRVAARGPLARFGRDENGAAVIEFAILSPIFIALVFMFFETAYNYWTDRMLQFYAADVARSLRTGYTPTKTTIDPKTGKPVTSPEDLCRDRAINLFVNCAKVAIDARPAKDVPPVRRDANGKIDASGFSMQPGQAGSVNVVRVFYEMDRVFGVPITASGAPKPDGKVEFYAAAAFVREF